MDPNEVQIVAYGEISIDENANGTDLDAEGVFVQIVDFDTNGVFVNTTPDHTSDNITILVPGVYSVICTISAQSSQSHNYHFAIFKSGSELTNMTQGRHTTIASKIGAVALSGFVALVATDTIDLRVERRDGGAVTKTIIIEHATLCINRIGP